MEDREIVDLYFERSESAIIETENKYGKYCRYIAYNILRSESDAEECVNDAYLKVWDSVPPKRPERLSAYVGKITRNVALDRYEKNRAQKRGGGEVALSFEELRECIPSDEKCGESLILKDALNRFLVSLSSEKRKIFVRRYWYFSSVKDISAEYHISQSKVKMTLLRLRNELKEFLQQEDISI